MSVINFILLVLVFLTSVKINAQELSWVTVGSAEGASDNFYETTGNYITELNGSVYVAGKLGGSESFIQDSIYNDGDFNFVAKFNPKGNLQWTKRFKGYVYSDICTDNNKYLFISYSNYFGDKGYIMKVDTSGNVIWDIEAFPFNTYGGTYKLIADNAGSVIVSYATSYYDTLFIADTAITGFDHLDRTSFIAKYDSEGSFKWVTAATGKHGTFNVKDLAVDSKNNILLTGNTSIVIPGDTVFIGGKFLDNQNIEDNSSPQYYGYQNIFALKLKPNGQCDWTQVYGGGWSDYGESITVDGSDNVYLTGAFRGQAIFADTVLENVAFSLGLTNWDIFLAGLNAQGETEWVKQAGTSLTAHNYLYDTGTGVSVQDSNVFLVGKTSFESYFDDEMLALDNASGFIANYTIGGEFNWVTAIEGENTIINDVKAVSDDIFITGFFIGETNFFDSTLQSVFDYRNMFFAAAIKNKKEVVVPTSLNEKVDLSVYPNPTKGVLNIGCTGLELFDAYIYKLDGSKVESFQGLTKTIEIDHLPKGVYLLEIVSNTVHRSIPIIKN